MRYKKDIILKNGKGCTLRNCAPGDAEAVIDFFILTHGQTDLLLTYPDEKSRDVAREREDLAHAEASEREAQLVAFTDGMIAGSAGITPVGHKFKIRHRCALGITVDRAMWGLGIGEALTRACVECAGAAGYSRIELQVVAENRAAIGMYEKLGFKEYGRDPTGFLSRSGEYQELVFMKLELEEKEYGL